jgi:hypothetical protein
MKLRLALLLFVAPGALASAADTIDFNRDIRPILSNNCFKCHGPDEDLREVGLRLDEPASATSELESGSVAITPGKPDESKLIARINSEDPDVVMPPPASNKHLTAAQKQLLREWIAAGAEYKQHWAFVKPGRPVVPEIRNPKFEVRNSIDNFIAARLDHEKLALFPEVDRHTLIRRVYLDLIGIPPTPEEADAFVNDTSTDAYEKLVDRLLASSHYGERWARRWLDLARYADTNGYEKDRPRSMWPYRDWVIKALNDDMPFDQFTIRQIAGDMLPGATIDDIIATGFHRNTMINEEGGIDPQEFRFYSNVDRVGTTATVWLGLTMACSQCHTHKYDPITHKEFYQLMSFFDEADEPRIDVPQAEIDKRRPVIEAQIAAAEADLPNHFPVEEDFEFTVARPVTAVSTDGAVLVAQDDDSVLVSGPTPDTDTYTVEFDVSSGEIVGLRVEALTDPSLPSKGPGRTPHGNFVLSGLTITAAPSNTPKEAKTLKIVRAEADYAQPQYGPEGVFDADPHTGWAIHDLSNPNWNTNRTATFYLEVPYIASGGARMVVKLSQKSGGKHTLGKFRLSFGKTIPSTDNADRRRQLTQEKFREWLSSQEQHAIGWTVLEPTKMSSNLPTLDRLEDNSILVSGDQTKLDVYELTYANALPTITALRLEAIPHPSLPRGGPGRVYYEGSLGDFFLSELAVTAGGQPTTFAGAAQSIGSAKNAVDSKPETGWSIMGGQGMPQVAVLKFAQPIAGANQLDVRMTFEQYYAAAIGRFRVSVTSDPQPIDHAAHPADIGAILTKPAADRSEAERERLFKHYLSIVPELSAAWAKIDELRKQLQYPTTLVMKQRSPDRYRQTHRRHRGEFLQPKEAVEPGSLAILHPMPNDGPRDRLALAKWLVDRDNPLTARVTMNRHWAAFFGRGLVRTMEDFGTQGELPTHPELLDWLAVEFMDRGWSQKAMHKLIVTSAVYRQSSRITAEMLERDPQNRLYARGPRVRLEAELVRDSVLAAAGLLSRKIGGPSVYPPQLASITNEGAFVGLPWNISQGEDRYRRSLYTFSRRTAPFAMFATFDAPSGEACIPRRDTSNTPLQALTLMNDAMFMEAAEALGKAYSTASGSAEERALGLFRRCFTRPPQPEELTALVKFVNAQRERFPNDELKVWTALARAMINVDEMIVKQ